MLRGIIGDHIIIETRYAEQLGHVKVDANQLEVVIMNLLVNARDAMPDGGVVRIETSNVELDEADAEDAMKAGPHVMIAVTDSGCGMDVETQAKIFEPFFTTKAVGEGTGLGLSTIYGIIKQSGGNIQVANKLGGGATFKIYLPREAAEIEPATTQSSPNPIVGVGEHVLVVEDEEALRRMLKVMLQRLDYQVTVAANGEEALHLVEVNALNPDLLLTDIMMPGINGFVLAERLRQGRPELKVLFMSGYSQDAIPNEGVIDAGTPLLEKPIDISSLGEQVRIVLNGH